MKQKFILWLIKKLRIQKSELPQEVFWVSAAAPPNHGNEVLCETEHKTGGKYIVKDYCKGQWDNYAKVFYTTKGGSYKVLNCVRWMEIWTEVE